MSWIHLGGYFLALVIGFSLGLIGGGGSILTIPVLVYFFDIEPSMAATYSLFIVGLAAVSGSIGHYRMHDISYKTVLFFGAPSVLILFIVRKWLINFIPPVLFISTHAVITKSLFFMIIFSALMLAAGFSMIKQNNYSSSEERKNLTRLFIQGLVTGAITGFIGIGGGFIIVPSLVLFAGLPMKRAIGTSLTIITVNCIVGILGNFGATGSLNFSFLLAFASLAIMGIIVGTWATRYISDKKLKPFFGWIILSMSLVVFVRVFFEIKK
jgi:uncharacterized membrane protein YfcA